MGIRGILASLFVLSAALATTGAFTGCTALLGDFDVSTVPAEGGSAGAKANGDSCAAGSECTSTFCADGVCCESACSGVCESCAIDRGKCAPVPDGQDPAKECLPEARPDAGEAPAGDTDAGAGDGGGALNVPDGGLTSDDVPCGGSCNGARACKFPGPEVTCGTKFCNTGSEAARFACDKKGRCELELEVCTSFSCESSECRKTCAEQNDCQSTHFCNTTGVCQERLADGIGCTLADQCKSGFCVTSPGSPGGVCCNSACDVATFGAGSTCQKAGSVGKCQCSINCGAGSCRLYHKDSDTDGYGDKDTVMVGCDNLPAPPTFVADSRDCDDGDARAHPGQSEWYADVTTGKGLNDFDCDGKVEKETKEYPGATCTLCGPPSKCIPELCKKAATQGRLTCEPYKGLSGTTCGYGLRDSNIAGFTSTVACGATATTFTTCGVCGGVVGQAPPSTVGSKQQRCH